MVMKMAKSLTNKNSLAEKQQEILVQIQKSRRLVQNQLYSSLYVIFMFLVVIIVFYFFVFEEIWAIDVIIFSLNTSIFALVALNNFRTLWPFWKKIDQYFKQIKKKAILTDSTIIHEGISSCVNQIQSVIFTSLVDDVIKGEPSKKFTKQISTRLNRSWIVQIVMGIIIVIINHLVIVILYQPQIGSFFWLYIMYIGILLTYGAMVVLNKKVKSMFRRWLEIFLELEEWGESLELLPINHEIDLINDIGEK